ncbi:MAG: thioredoxin family protein [Planctomycetota bacterium]|nr:thioredoxin family protein [Planctomycetota bacterium]
MAPILENLKKDYADKFVVEFIDVNERENIAKARQYGIRMIRTRFDEQGKELWRHEGFMSKGDILQSGRTGMILTAPKPMKLKRNPKLALTHNRLLLSPSTNR